MKISPEEYEKNYKALRKPSDKFTTLDYDTQEELFEYIREYLGPDKKLNSTRKTYNQLAADVSDFSGVRVTPNYYADLYLQRLKKPEETRECYYDLLNATMTFFENEYLKDNGEHKKRKKNENDKRELELKIMEGMSNLVIANDKGIEPETRTLTISDLDEMAVLQRKRAGGGEFHKNFFERILQQNKGIMKGLFIKSEISRKYDIFYGFFIILPITNVAANYIDRGSIHQSSRLPEDQICSIEEASALYISWVISLDNEIKLGGNRNEGIVITLRKEVKDILKKYSKIDKVYMRPGEDDGLSMAISFGFTPVNPLKGERSISVKHRKDFRGSL